jgi:methyl coenzyme M reductase subunit D
MSETDISTDSEVRQGSFHQVAYAMFDYLKTGDDIATLATKLAAVTYSCGERGEVENLVEFLDSKIKQELNK